MKSLHVSPKAVWAVVVSLVVGALTIGSLALAPATVTYAAAGSPTPGARATQRAANIDQRLQGWYQREQNLLSAQQTHLDKANEIAGKVQTYINNQNAKGKDTSALTAALATFQQQLTTAQSSHATAASILSAHAGFDANGQVTDADQARQTVLSARQSLRDAHITLRQAGADLRKAIREWREANRPTHSAATATP